ncbi:hypothetical protein HYPBUDRAFT_192703 [Hyphopichia burtonii NRRL Y-1933]|uniref:Uncharacterized protein n=1 Tax=Hyphopichia burtonii NRRL Y-1933 TaxID=984485 RepID=A0A1E4RP86_9ASCO|nr:hypothetical protein HYPBUDRAFT_192703 [Hyphopichia burtonii NRRL Y-1933]ODV68895.1 hypothetical protein HYPBUDRAFT_192703 [Hyphopichia burtonii NRRL Y-1933]
MFTALLCYFFLLLPTCINQGLTTHHMWKDPRRPIADGLCYVDRDSFNGITRAIMSVILIDDCEQYQQWNKVTPIINMCMCGYIYIYI